MRGPRHTIVTRRWPERYFTGLSPAMRHVRENELLRRRTLPYSKLGLAKSNTFAKPKKSRWTELFHKTYPGLKFNKAEISRRTGISRSVLNTVYNRGLKAWKTGGSRVGANPQQWATARVYKFVLVSKKKAPNTKFDPDQDLRR
jgi:Family of unknown function (DUF5824)